VTVSGFNLHGRFTPRQSSVYAGLEASLVDWAASVSELALRRADVDYDNPGLVALDMIRPRLDLMIGLPVLTERLAMSLGASWRLIAPVPGHAGDAADKTTPNAFTYLPFWSGDDRLKRGSHAAFIELSAGVHYVF
jgi:hypothetical protein